MKHYGSIEPMAEPRPFKGTISILLLGLVFDENIDTYRSKNKKPAEAGLLPYFGVIGYSNTDINVLGLTSSISLSIVPAEQ